MLLGGLLNPHDVGGFQIIAAYFEIYPTGGLVYHRQRASQMVEQIIASQNLTVDLLHQFVADYHHSNSSLVL